SLEGEHVVDDLRGGAEDSVEAWIDDRRVLTAIGRRLHGLIEAPAGFGVSLLRIFRTQRFVQRGAVQPLAAGDGVGNTTESPASVGRRPVELWGIGPGRALLQKTSGLIDSPEPRVEVALREGQALVRQGPGRAGPAMGRCRHHAVALPGEPLI